MAHGASKSVKFGVKLDISVIDGWTRLETYSFDAYNEARNLLETADHMLEISVLLLNLCKIQCASSIFALPNCCQCLLGKIGYCSVDIRVCL